MPSTKINKMKQRVARMESVRAPFLDLWKEISENFTPHRGRYHLDESYKGKRLDTKILNNSPLMSRRVLAAGLMSGMTSPARPWFVLSTGESELDSQDTVKQWLYACRDIMLRVFGGSNLYNSLQTYYGEVSTFSTAAMGVYEDDESFLRFETLTAGQYSISRGKSGKIESLAWKRKRTVEEIVGDYGYENVPASLKSLWDRGNIAETATLVTLVEPNDDRGGTVFAWDMPYRSVTWVDGANDTEAMVRESGFESFPFLVSRWDVASGDEYGTESPAMDSLGDAKALQIAETDILTILDRMADPALIADTKLRRSLGDRSPVPGSITYSDHPDSHIKALISDSRSALNEVSEMAARYERRVSVAFYEDMFLMLANTDRREITAREVAERHEEKLLQLGPVLERLQDELLKPLISRTFEILQRQRVLPEAPPELDGRELTVEYVSILAQAQKLVALQGVDRLLDVAAGIANLYPGIIEKMNFEEILEEYAEVIGVRPDLLRTKQQFAEAMQAQQEAQQAQQQGDAMSQGAAMAKDASRAQLEKPSALSEIMRRGGLA